MFRRAPRTGASADVLVVGLGNPGEEYSKTRHNVGAEVVEILARRHGGKLRKQKERSFTDEVNVGGKRMALAIPLTYMNLSGEAVAPLVRRYGVEPGQLVVVQDEMDFELGRLQVKNGGGLAGHNGLKSIVAHLHTQDFVRVRIGIGKPPGSRQGADHVLRRFSKAERQEIDVVLEEAADAVELILAEGVDVAMNRVNPRFPAGRGPDPG
ncbi:MAG TPA: aminoacyl-tRNA hydrolase [Acidimicrobiia bacterium]|nr:aminoacyl-tRNA hydrolase [Acidimicrobiia bacterium]